MKELIQRRLQLKNKFAKRKKIFGAWTSFAHPSITEIFCKGSFDFVGIDIEHSTISQEQSQRIIAASHSTSMSLIESLFFARLVVRLRLS